MDVMLEAFLPYEGAIIPDDIPKTKETIWILGKEYKPPHDIKVIRAHIRSTLWFTYRRGFDPIGETTYTSDRGWGCMLRCGQMMLARAYTTYYMGADWIWTPETQDQTYLKILHLFEDHFMERYSVHQIAMMGTQEGKKVGQWFSPNNIAQVLKKLSLHEYWTKFVVHVALHNTVIINEIKHDCKNRQPTEPEPAKHRHSQFKPPPRGPWSPLLLIIPLRLGMKNILPHYLELLKRCFMLEHSMGMLGGTPNHALYFFGCVGDEVFFFDPHTTQNSARVGDKSTWEQVAADETYHCDYAMRRKLSKMDPSLAVGFLCCTESDFDSLCKQLQAKKITTGDLPLFQIVDKRPQYMV
ncbi:cysteine protease ATG4B [Anabrus simplex]|uniref:cysteine protease ATG4B n=1 Tax=Anabrus simplex TaxID=316456 RepID=UPI0035A350FB